MAFKQHHRVTFGGTLSEYTGGPPDEIWACNVNVVGQTSEDFDEEAYLDAITPGLVTWFGNGTSGSSNEAHLTFVKCNKVGPDGRYIDSGATHRRDVNPPKAGFQGPVDPQIISVAISWSTAKSRGPGSHGRIYPPNATAGSSGRMTIDVTAQTNLAQGGFDLLKILENDGNAGPTVVPVISSKVNATNTQILGVRVGSVKDVQRRRKSALLESYVSKAFPPAVILIEN